MATPRTEGFGTKGTPLGFVDWTAKVKGWCVSEKFASCATEMSMTDFFEALNLYRPLGERISAEAAIKARGNNKENIWIGHLTKVGTRAVFDCDLRLIFALAELEANPKVESYQFDPTKVRQYLVNAGACEIDAVEVDFVVTFRSAEEQWWQVAETRPSKPSKHQAALTIAARKCGAVFLLRTLKDISPWEVRFHNWLDLSQAMVSTRLMNCSGQICEVEDLLHGHGQMTYGQLIDSVTGDPALTRSAIARLIQAGRASADLDTAILWPGTRILAPGAFPERAGAPEERAAIANVPHVASNYDSTGSSEVGNSDLPTVPIADLAGRRGRPRSAIGPASPPVDCWPRIVMENIPPEHQACVEKRKLAVELYAQNASARTITDMSGLPVSEARRLYRRCIDTDDQGRIYGFNGVLRYFHTNPYIRKEEVVPTDVDGTSGCAGALRKLFRELPEAEEFIRNQVGSAGSQPVAGTDSVKDMHESWKKELGRLGVCAPAWPFCPTLRSKGLQAYSTFVRGLREAKSAAGVRGGGYEPLIRALRPLTFMQLDYKKTDCGTVLQIEKSSHEQFFVPIRRWYKGFMCCEASTAITGLATLFEVEPSCDCALETVLSSLDPATDARYPDVRPIEGSNKFLLRHFVPELAWNGFLVMRVDNGVANRAYDFIHNTIDTVGCWVQFGPSYFWPARHQIERTMGIVTRAGEMRMPSSYGSNPNDPRRTNPEGAAIKYRILASKVVRIAENATGKVNTAGSESNEGSSRVSAVRAALRSPETGTYLRPLPRSTQLDHHLLGHYERRMVRRTRDRISVKVDHSLYTNGTLSMRPDLVGKWLAIFVGRRNAKYARAFVEGTGEDLGTLVGKGGYCKDAPWAYRKLVVRGIPEDEGDKSADAVEEWRQETAAALVNGKRRRSKITNDANRLASAVHRNTLSTEPTGSPTDTAPDASASADSPNAVRKTVAAPPEIDAADPFGINEIPQSGGRHAG